MKVTIKIDLRGATREEMVANAPAPVRWIAPDVFLPDGRQIRFETRGTVAVDPVLWQQLSDQLKKDVTICEDSSLERTPVYWEAIFVLVREVQ